MGNIISFDENISENDDSLSISNGLTDVFLDYLLVSGSELAKTDSEKILILIILKIFLMKVMKMTLFIADFQNVPNIAYFYLVSAVNFAMIGNKFLSLPQ